MKTRLLGIACLVVAMLVSGGWELALSDSKAASTENASRTLTADEMANIRGAECPGCFHMIQFDCDAPDEECPGCLESLAQVSVEEHLTCSGKSKVYLDETYETCNDQPGGNPNQRCDQYGSTTCWVQWNCKQSTPVPNTKCNAGMGGLPGNDCTVAATGFFCGECIRNEQTGITQSRNIGRCVDCDD